jgi:dihydroorotate dehydrogenase (fumarate)
MDLTTRYLGLSLANPLIAGAGPLNGELDNIRRLEDLGAGAVVLPSIFEEQIEYEERVIEELITAGTDSYSEALSYFPAQAAYAMDPERYLDFIRRATNSVDIPVIASLNGVTDHGWTAYARRIEEAGARAIELNIYFIPSDPDLTGQDVEQRYLDIVSSVRKSLTIPIAVKIGPYFSAPGHMARRFDQAGADGLVLFNRFYQPDIELVKLALTSDLELSRAYEIRLPLLWISLLSGRLKASLAASTGVEGADEVVKYLLAGADVVMTTSSLLRHGIGHMKDLLDGLKSWLAARDLESVSSIRGRMSRRNVTDRTAFERANYIKTLQFYGASRGAAPGAPR